MISEFQAVLGGGPRDVTVDFTAPHKGSELGRLRALTSIRAIGDVAFYYLPYVPMLAGLDSDIRMPCIRREKKAVVDSYAKAMRMPTRHRSGISGWIKTQFKGPPAPRYRNHWVVHDGKRFVTNEKWDSCFPKFQAPDLKAAIGLYWDHYNRLAEGYAQTYPEKFRIFDIDYLNTETGQRAILSFCGFENTPSLGKFHFNAGQAAN